MAKNSIKDMDPDDVAREVANGGRLVIYQYAVSAILVTVLQSSDIRLIRADKSAVKPGLGYVLLSGLAGWWGFPWGPIRTIQAIGTNLSGGKDVTREVMNAVRQPPPPVPVASPAVPAAMPVEPVPAPEAQTPPPGWYTDPTGEYEARYWDGTSWTAQGSSRDALDAG